MTQSRQKQGGRKKGTPNKVTADVRAAILRAFEEVGGEAYLVRVARANPKVFCALLGKVVPALVEATVEHRHAVRVPEVVEDAETWQQRHGPTVN